LKNFVRLVFVFSLVVAPLASQVALAQTSVIQEQESSSDDAEKPKFGGRVALSNTLGLGTFVAGSDQREYDLVAISVNPFWRVEGDKRVAFMKFSVSQELLQNYESATTTPNQILLSDLELGYVHNNLYKIAPLGISVSPYISGVVGTSLASRYANRLGVIRVGSKFGYSYKKTMLMYETRVGKNFNRFTSPTVDAGLGVAFARDQGNEDLGGVIAIGGRNIEFSWMNRGTAMFTLPSKLYLTFDYVFVKYFTYAADNEDGLTPENGDSGRGVRDLTQSTIDLSWQTPKKELLLSVGASTSQSPLTSDNSSIRFPFFDFISPNSNRTTFYLALTGTY